MNEKPLTATMIREANREYWSRPDVIERGRRLDAMFEWALRAFMDIICKRVKDGWPTRDAAAPEEDC